MGAICNEVSGKSNLLIVDSQSRIVFLGDRSPLDNVSQWSGQLKYGQSKDDIPDRGLLIGRLIGYGHFHDDGPQNFYRK